MNTRIERIKQVDEMQQTANQKKNLSRHVVTMIFLSLTWLRTLCTTYSSTCVAIALGLLLLRLLFPFFFFFGRKFRYRMFFFRFLDSWIPSFPFLAIKLNGKLKRAYGFAAAPAVAEQHFTRFECVPTRIHFEWNGFRVRKPARIKMPSTCRTINADTVLMMTSTLNLN